MGEQISPFGTGSILATPAFLPRGGQERMCNFLISQAVLSSFHYFFGVRGANSMTIKTGLNCRHDFDLNCSMVMIFHEV